MIGAGLKLASFQMAMLGLPSFEIPLIGFWPDDLILWTACGAAVVLAAWCLPKLTERPVWVDVVIWGLALLPITLQVSPYPPGLSPFEENLPPREFMIEPESRIEPDETIEPIRLEIRRIEAYTIEESPRLGNIDIAGAEVAPAMNPFYEHENRTPIDPRRSNGTARYDCRC